MPKESQLVHKKITVAVITLLLPCMLEAGPHFESIKTNMPQLESKPSKRHKILCYSKPWGFQHPCIPTGNDMVQAMADKTYLFEVQFTENVQMFSSDNLRAFDAVVFNNCTHIQKGIQDESLRQSLIDFVKSGGGFIGIHSASDGGWPAYTEMLGGDFDGHPWSARGTWGIANEDPTHPIVNDVYGGQPFTLKDELYQYKLFDRTKVRVLLAVDMSHPANLVPNRKRMDNDYALVWIKRFGQGRVFFSALGHNEEIFSDPQLLKMWVRGFRYALGELEAPEDSIKKKPITTPAKPAPTAPLPAVRYRTAEDSMKEFDIKEGYQLQLVAEAPMVVEPVLTVWDGNGRMYVAEFHTYMQDADGTGQFEKKSRVVRLEDTDGDGRMDKRIIFADNLVLPRLVLPLDDRILICQTNTFDIHSYRDTNGDGVADEIKPWYLGGPQGGNLEHQPGGLVWAMDNWIYTTWRGTRLRFTDGQVRAEEINRPSGQWGLDQDNHGLLIYVNAGGENGPQHFQFPHYYMNWIPRWEQEKGYKTVWPICQMPDTQGGRPRLRDNNTLNHITATCGPAFYRGGQYAQDMQNDLFFAEPVGRLVRRSKIFIDTEGRRIIKNAYLESEFIRSKDPNFRPVNLATGPDGALYLCDMQRGIIQEGQWTPRGSYLRDVIEEYGLHFNHSHGRIYRLIDKNFKSFDKPKLLDATPIQLMGHLSHPNGWWRDQAQKLLVLKADASVLPELRLLAQTNATETTRLHALWTMEGLGTLDLEFLRAFLKDSSPLVREHAIRLCEPFLKSQPGEFALLEKMSKETHPSVVKQLLLTAHWLGTEPCNKLIQDLLANNPANSYAKELNGALSQHFQNKRKNAQNGFQKGSGHWALMQKGEALYKGLCHQCHGNDGRGTVSTGGVALAPSLANNPHVLRKKEVPIKIILHGMTGPLAGKDYGIMISMKNYTDEELAGVLTYIRNSFGNKASPILAHDVAQVRKQTTSRTSPYTSIEVDEMLQSNPGSKK